VNRAESSQSLALLECLDAIDHFNSFSEPHEREPEPQGTKGITVDVATAERLAEQLCVPERLARFCLMGRPVKQARALRNWMLSKQGERDYDAAQILKRWTNAHGGYLSERLFEEIMEGEDGNQTTSRLGASPRQGREGTSL
jgi:hypothetical protein